MRTWWWSRLLLILPAVAAAGCFPVSGGGRWEMGFKKSGQAWWGSTVPTALPVGLEVELPVVFNQGCRTELEFIGKGRVCVDGDREDSKLHVSAATKGDAFSVTTSANRVRIRAVREGDAAVTITARNSSGDERSRTLDLRAARPARVTILLQPAAKSDRPGCFAERTPAKRWFEAGKPFTLGFQLVSADVKQPSRIIGVPVGISAKGSPGFSQVSYRELQGSMAGASGSAEGTYLAAEPGTLSLESAALPGFRTEVAAYGCATLTGIAFRDLQPWPGGTVDVAHMIGDDPVCGDATACPISVTVETPEVCELISLRGQALSQGIGGKQWVSKRGPGKCRLTATAKGTPLTASVEFEFGKAPPPPPEN